MKKFMNTVWILAASALAFSSCVEEQALAPQNENPEMVNIEITAGAPVTKTHFDGTMQIKWDTDTESIVVFENTVANNKTSTATGPDNDPVGYQISSDGSTATFNVEFYPKSGNEFNYWGLYPASSFISADNADLNCFKMQIPSVQKPKAKTFDYKADLLISRKITKKSQPSGLNFNLTRPIAVVEMTLKGIGDGEKITEVTFSSESAPITGQMTYNLNTNEVIAYGIDGQKKITLNTNLTAASAGTKIYFTALPAALDDFTVTARTDKATYEKKVDCSGMNFGFKANTFTSFPVNNLTKKSIAKPVLTINWDNQAVLDNQGGNFSIPYTIENPVEGATLVLSTMNGILQNLKAENGTITFTLEANPEKELRNEHVFCEYKLGSQVLASKTLDIKQAAKEAGVIQNMTFEIVFDYIKATYVIAKCTPSDPDGTYAFELVRNTELENITPAEFAKSKYDFWKDPANNDPIENHLLTGWQKKTFNNDFKQAVDFSVIAFGLASDGTMLSENITVAPVQFIHLTDWDNNVYPHPRAGGDFVVHVYIANGDATTQLTASTYESWLNNIQVVKVSDKEWTVSFHANEGNSGWGEIALKYGSIKSKIAYN